MSSTPPPPKSRNWTLPIIAGAAALAVVLLVCVVGSATAYFTLRDRNTGAPAPTPTPAPVRPQSPAAAKSPADCLIGDWTETSYVSTAEINGTRVQLTGKGTLVRFSPDGTTTSVYDNIVVSGTASGKSYEVVHNGTTLLNYQSDEKNIHYSNPRVDGTTTWKINGKVDGTQPMKVLLTPETYRCSGNDLRLYGDQYAIELQRILPPGIPA